MSVEIDKKDMDLFKQKEKEYNEVVKEIKTKKDNFEKKYKKSNIDDIKKKVEKIKKNSEEIKARVEQYKKEEENKKAEK